MMTAQQALPTTPKTREEVDKTPAWLAELERRHMARAAHFFLLHFNVSDYVFDGQRLPFRLIPYLAQHLDDSGYARIGLFSLSGGLAWAANPSADASASEPRRETPGGSPTDASSTQPEPAAGSSNHEPIAVLARLEQELAQSDDQPVAVIIENVEHLTPHAVGLQDREAIRATEILTRIALSDRLRAADCLIIGICRSPEAVAPALIEATGGVVPIKVPLPGPGGRRRYIDFLASSGDHIGLAPLESNFSRDSLVNLTQGFTLADLDALNRDALVSDTPITYEMVRQRKQDTIAQQSKGILQELEPRYGFESIGGLGHIVAYLNKVVTDLRERRLEAVPKGILLGGPPGTGKTLIAEALAKEAGFNLVRMGDVRSMWVGESERNLSHVLRVLLALEPVIVFVDEIDQALGARDRGFSGDSGVSARIFGRILNFMGQNEHRGRVMWIAATNRPDLLDEAMIRRFDRVFPFFLPSASERDKIWRVMPKLTGLTYASNTEFSEAVEQTNGLTGSALEMIARRAVEIAGGKAVNDTHLGEAIKDYKPNHDADTYLLQSLLALNATNLYSALPADADLPDEVREIVTTMRKTRSAGPLHQRIAELREKRGER